MKKRIYGILLLGALLACFASCSVQNDEIATMLPTEAKQEILTPESPEVRTFSVSTVDQFLDALNSNTVIELQEGFFHLNDASDYGMDTDNPAYYWEDRGDGFQLVLNHLHDLTIRGTDRELTSLLNASVFSNVLVLDHCKRVTLQGFTAGHSDGAELCSGGVVYTDSCEQIRLSEMGLFGCGTVGIDAYYTQGLTLDRTDIYDCSLCGMRALESNDLFLKNCNFYELGTPEEPAMTVFSLGSCRDIQAEDCSISENNVSTLLSLEFSENAVFKNSEFRANKIGAYAFRFMECQPVFDHTSFEYNDLRQWYESTSQPALDEYQNPVTEENLPAVTALQPVDLPEQTQIHVADMDEFLAAIGPDRAILLDETLFDFSTASDYGKGSSQYYRWDDGIDGPELVIYNVDNMSILGNTEDILLCHLSALPRYSNVLSFYNCHDITFKGFTAGHREEPGFCTGGVLFFRDCDRINIDRCGLYGCGILGVNAEFCSQLRVADCDIYDCSFGGIQLLNINGVKISYNNFYDLGGPSIMAEGCSNVESDTEVSRFPGYTDEY